MTLPERIRAIPCSGEHSSTAMYRHGHGDAINAAAALVEREQPLCRSCGRTYQEHTVAGDGHIHCPADRENSLTAQLAAANAEIERLDGENESLLERLKTTKDYRYENEQLTAERDAAIQRAERAEAIIPDLATLVRRLCRRLRDDGRNASLDLIAKATDYLRRKGIPEGSILRDD